MADSSGNPAYRSAVTPSSRTPGKGGVAKWVLRAGVLALVLVAIVSAMGYGPTKLVSLGGRDSETKLSTYTVKPGELLITVTEDGNVESAANIDIKCQVAGGSAILWIIKDGEDVKKGDKLVELDSASIETEMNTQRITYNKARAAVIQAEKNFEVAKISVREYLEGTYLQELETAETQITIAEENLRSAKNALEYSERMFQRGYISELELESQQFAVKRAQLELNSARTAKKVLEEFTRAKMMEDLQSQVETAQATMESEKAAFELEETKLKRLETQLENCVIYAPQDGMVVYANERGGRFGQESSGIEEGAAVRDRQTILRLPDLSRMQVKVTVHETKVEDLRPGMRARINIQGRELLGTLVSVSNQPEQTNFWQGNVKEYAAIVRIDGNPAGLKPGMTAEVEVLIDHLKDVLTVPVSAVVEQRGEFFSWVKSAERVERRKLLLGKTNDQFVEVQDGVAAGDEVVRNPRAVIGEASGGTLDRPDVDVEAKFGPAGAASPAPAGVDAQPAAPGAAAGGPEGARGPGGERGPGAERDEGRRGGGRRSFDLMQMDQDGDGKVSKDEAPEPMQNFFDRIDTSGDGFIDKAEADEMRSRMPRGGPGAGGGPGGGFGGGPPGG
jgi:HlyD family secretion protein